MKLNVSYLFLAVFFTMACKNYEQVPDLVLESEELIFEEGRFFDQCHASTIEETSSGDLLVSWFGGSGEGAEDVAIWGSLHDGERWSQPRVLADGRVGDSLKFPCWNPVLFRPEDEGRIFLYYKVGPNPREWWGMTKVSDDGGRTWGSERRLPDGILGPIKNKPIELADGTVLAPSSVELTESRWVAHVERSDKQQMNWTVHPIDHESEFNVIQPSILVHPDNRLQVLCRSREGKVMSSWSEDRGLTWSSLTPTNLNNPNSATDAIRVNDYFLIVYNPDTPGKNWWEGRSQLNVAYSLDGLEWTDILELENESTGEFSYPTIFLDSQNKIHITYTFDRKNIKHVVLSEK